MVTTKCPTCGKEFSARATLHQRFCSKECTDISFQHRITLVCQICQKSFIVRAKARSQKYCSRACRTIGIGKTESYIEKIMAHVLSENDIDVIPQYSVGPYTIDFAIPDRLIAIECDGDYWHSLPDSHARDQRKDKFLYGRGWRVIRLSETEIKTDTVHCLSKIKQALSQ
jgi:very-short-patch-repair endonuclease